MQKKENNKIKEKNNKIENKDRRNLEEIKTSKSQFFSKINKMRKPFG